MMEIETRTPEETERLGGLLAETARPGSSVHLSGDLAAGKTTLVRGFLRALGYPGRVVSPTYTLVEPYETARFPVHHFDLYRLKDPGELETLGFRDYFDGGSVCLVEWPERGVPLLAAPDLDIRLAIRGPARLVTLRAGTPAGTAWLERLGLARAET